MIKKRTDAEASEARSKMLAETAEQIDVVWKKTAPVSMKDRIVVVEQRRDDAPHVISASAKKLIQKHKLEPSLVDALTALRPNELFVVVLGWGGVDGGYVEVREGVLRFRE